MKLRDLFNELNSMIAAGFGTTAIDSFLKSQGCFHIGSGSITEAWAIEMPWGKVAVKYSILGGDFPSFVELRSRFPLVFKRYIKPLFQSAHVAIQPMAETRSEEIQAASEWLEKWFVKLYNAHFDVHPGNVGWYRGKIMTFDVFMPECNADCEPFI